VNRPSFVVSRRLVLQGAAAIAGATFLPTRVLAAGDAVLFTIADLHSPYARLPALLQTIRRLNAEAAKPAALLLNGDIFELGNAVSVRSGGAADFAFLKALAAELPVIVNIGNHEPDTVGDLATFVALANAAGVEVISNLVDNRTGRFFAPVSTRFGLGGFSLAALGLATTNPFVYPQPSRDTLTFLDPAAFVASAYADARGEADVGLVMSHAGVTADKAFVDTLSAGTIVQGAHDHLTFSTERNGGPYFHGSSWGVELGVLDLARTSDGVASSYRTVAIAPSGGDAELADMIAGLKDEHLNGEDTAVLAEIDRDMTMHESILIAAEAVRDAADADVAVLGHTTFGAPLAKGPLTKYDFDAFIRFGGGISAVDISGRQLAQIVARGNQFMAETLEGRTGDYVHVAEMDIDPARTYRFATNAWTGINQEAYLGTTDLSFEAVGDLELKSLVAAYLAAD